MTKDRLSKQRVIYQSGSRAITGLAMRTVGSSMILYISTEHQVVAITVSNKDKDKAVRRDRHELMKRSGDDWSHF